MQCEFKRTTVVVIVRCLLFTCRCRSGLSPFSRDRSKRPFSRFTGLWRAEKKFK